MISDFSREYLLYALHLFFPVFFAIIIFLIFPPKNTKAAYLKNALVDGSYRTLKAQKKERYLLFNP